MCVTMNVRQRSMLVNSIYVNKMCKQYCIMWSCFSFTKKYSKIHNLISQRWRYKERVCLNNNVYYNHYVFYCCTTSTAPVAATITIFVSTMITTRGYSYYCMYYYSYNCNFYYKYTDATINNACATRLLLLLSSLYRCYYCYYFCCYYSDRHYLAVW